MRGAAPAAAHDVARGLRFHWLDALRGVAALCVVLYHWPHFYFEGAHVAPGFVPERDLPLYAALAMLYEQGWRAVDLFFALSGFIFHCLYRDAIASGAITARTFVARRISRLYPLHLATLLLVAVLAHAYFALFGRWFVYENNDVGHFVLSMLLASDWGLQDGYSFNGPTWSVSIEALLYAAFFAVCRMVGARSRRVWWAASLVLALLGLVAVRPFNVDLARGIACFFIGGACFLSFERLSAARRPRRVASALLFISALAWGATFALMPAFVHAPSFRWVATLVSVGFLFPITIVALALAENLSGSHCRPLEFLGSISYSSYLLHFPLQLAIAIAVGSLALPSEVFRSPLTLLGFFFVLVVASRASYRYLERPMQDFLRAKFREDVKRDRGTRGETPGANERGSRQRLGLASGAQRLGESIRRR